MRAIEFYLAARRLGLSEVRIWQLRSSEQMLRLWLPASVRDHDAGIDGGLAHEAWRLGMRQMWITQFRPAAELFPVWPGPTMNNRIESPARETRPSLAIQSG
jgi:hypothetical protein